MSELKVNKVSPRSGTSFTFGDSGDTFTVPTGASLVATDELKTNKISPSSGTAFTFGDSGDTFTIPAGATIANSGTATGFASDSDYKHLTTTTVSSPASTVDFTSVFASDDGFQSYTLIGDTVYPSSDNVGMRLRLKKASGTISSSHYVWHVGGGEVSGSGSNFTQSNGAYNDQEFDFVGPAGGNPGNDANFGGTNFIVEVFHPTETRYTNVLWRYTHVRYDEATVHNVIGAGVLRTTDAITGLNLFFTSGNIASGSLTLYGRK